MVHNMLEGKVVEGNHEQLITKELFLRVNGLMKDNAHGYTINEENAAIRLKRFVNCGHCGQPLRGYIVKKKNVHYYKCNTKACNNNKNAKDLNNMFVNILESFKIEATTDVMKLIKKQTVVLFNQLTADKQNDLKLLQSECLENGKKDN